jgi:hypothetical protein
LQEGSGVTFYSVIMELVWLFLGIFGFLWVQSRFCRYLSVWGSKMENQNPTGNYKILELIDRTNCREHIHTICNCDHRNWKLYWIKFAVCDGFKYMDGHAWSCGSLYLYWFCISPLIIVFSVVTAARLVDKQLWTGCWGAYQVVNTPVNIYVPYNWFLLRSIFTGDAYQ